MNDNVNLAQVIALIKKMGGGSASGGTSNYLDLSNKPQINGVDLNGNKNLEDFGYPIFYWNGESSDKNSATIELWRKILKLSNEGKTSFVIIEKDASGFPSLMICNYTTFRDINGQIVNGKRACYTLPIRISQTTNAYYSTQVTHSNFIWITTQDEEVITISGINASNVGVSYLDPGRKSDYYFTPTSNIQPVSKGYLDERLADIEPSDAKIFYWDGQGSDTNADNITLWQNIIDTAKEQTVLVYATKEDSPSSYYKSIFLFSPNDAEKYISGSQSMFAFTSNPVSDNHNKTNSYLTQYRGIISFNFEDSSVVSVSEIKYGSSTVLSYLTLSKDYETPYEPLYAGSPATKKYVDDQVGNIATILDSINGEEV